MNKRRIKITEVGPTIITYSLRERMPMIVFIFGSATGIVLAFLIFS